MNTSSHDYILRGRNSNVSFTYDNPRRNGFIVEPIRTTFNMSQYNLKAYYDEIRNFNLHYWFVTFGIRHGEHDSLSNHERFFVPRRIAKNRNGKIIYHEQGYAKTYEVSAEDLKKDIITSWITPMPLLQSLSPPLRNAVNSTKLLLNSDHYFSLLVFHDKEGKDPCRLMNMSKNNKDVNEFETRDHFHMVIVSKQSSIHSIPEFRSLKLGWVGTNGYVNLTKVSVNIEEIMKYLIRSDGKRILGSRSMHLLNLFNQAIRDQTENDQFDDEADDRTLIEAKDDQPPVSNVEHDSSRAPFISQKKDNTNRVHFILDLLRKYPQANSFTELAKFTKDDPKNFNALINIASLPNSRMLWSVATDLMVDEEKTKTLFDIIDELPDTLENTMTVEHSASVFVGWCNEQRLNPHKITTIYIALLKQKIHKKICLYLQGDTNSGKTTMTTNMFRPMEGITGKVTNDNFPFQEMHAKRIVVGEEIGLTSSNIDQYKSILSGSKVTIARKHKSAGYVKPDLVLLNSNVRLTHNLPSKDADPLKSRMFVLPDLQSSQLLKTVYGHLHPKLFTAMEPPTEEMISAVQLADSNSEEYWLSLDNKPLYFRKNFIHNGIEGGQIYEYQGDFNLLDSFYASSKSEESSLPTYLKDMEEMRDDKEIYPSPHNREASSEQDLKLDENTLASPTEINDDEFVPCTPPRSGLPALRKHLLNAHDEKSQPPKKRLMLRSLSPYSVETVVDAPVVLYSSVGLHRMTSNPSTKCPHGLSIIFLHRSMYTK